MSRNNTIDKNVEGGYNSLMDETQIYDLQIKISYLEDFINSLNIVILDQNNTIDTLKRELKIQKDKIAQLEERIESKNEFKADETPPHY